jgi:itaconate CoA-transferase
MRGTTGAGTIVDVSLFDSLAEWMGFAAYYTAYGGTAPARTGANHASIAPYGPFACRGGESIYLGIQNGREWTRFCSDVLNRPDLAEDERFRTNSLRVRHRAALHDVIVPVVRQHSASQMIDRLEAAKIAWSRMNSVADFLEHPQLGGRDCWREIDSPVGKLRALVPPVRIPDVDAAMGPVPALGEHTDMILEELGIDPQTIVSSRREGTT